MDEWRLGNTIVGVLRELGCEEGEAWGSLTLLKWLTTHQRWFETKASDQNPPHAIMESLLKDEDLRQFLRINQYQGAWWFNKEAFEEMLWWLLMVAAVTIGSDPLRPINGVVEELERCYSVIQEWQQAEKKSEYQVGKLLSALGE